MKKIEPLKSYDKSWFQEQISSGIGGLTALAKKTGTSTTAVKKKLLKLGLKPMEKNPGWPVIREIKKLRNKSIEWSIDNKSIINSKNKLEEISGTAGFSPVVTRALINKYCDPGNSVLDSYVWSGSTMLGTLSTGCLFNGIVHSPKLYTKLQKMVELIGTIRANIHYEEIENAHRYKLILAYLPDPPALNKKDKNKIIEQLFRTAPNLLTGDGRLAIYCPGWSQFATGSMKETESVGIRSGYDRNGKNIKIVRIFYRQI